MNKKILQFLRIGLGVSILVLLIWRIKPLRPTVTFFGERAWYVMRKTKAYFRPKIHVEDIRTLSAEKTMPVRDINEEKSPIEETNVEQPPKIAA